MSLTKEEKSELELLRLYQADTRRWLSMDEFKRISELLRKQFERHLPLDGDSEINNPIERQPNNLKK